VTTIVLAVATLGRPTGTWGLWIGSMILVLLFAAAMQVLAPLTAFMAT